MYRRDVLVHTSGPVRSTRYSMDGALPLHSVRDLLLATGWCSVSLIFFFRRSIDHLDGKACVSLDFAGHIHRLCIILLCLLLSFFIVIHPYACYKLFKKFVFSLSLSLSRTSLPSVLLRSPFVRLFFSGFFNRFFRTKQNGIFLALEEKIHSSTFIFLNSRSLYLQS